MAIALEETVTGGLGGTGNYTLTSWTPQANELILVFVFLRNELSSISVFGNDLTFDLVAQVDGEQGQNGMNCYRAMGASPTTGQITVTGNSLGSNAIAVRLSGVDASGTNGSGAVEAFATDDGPVVDDADMSGTVTTLTDNAWAIMGGTHRSQNFTTPGGQTAIYVNLAHGTSPNQVKSSAVYKVVSPAGAATLGGVGSLGGATDWVSISVSIKPADASAVNLAGADVGVSQDFGALSQLQALTGFDLGLSYDYGVLSLLGDVALAGIEAGIGYDYGALSVLAGTPTSAPARLPIKSKQSAAKGLTLQVFEPLAVSQIQRGEYRRELSSYSQQIEAFGGYWSATIRLEVPRHEAEEWYENGPDRRIVTKSPDGLPIWEGFVNTVKLTLGGLQKTHGPVLDIDNQVALLYSYLLADGTRTGFSLPTALANDALSQDRYGVLQSVLSGGELTEAEASQLRDQYLVEHAKPPRSEEFALGGGAQSLELECLGYVRRMERYTYSSNAAGLQNLSTKLAAVLDADPNEFLSSSNAIIEANTLQVPVAVDSNSVALNVIKALCALGNASLDRCLFGVYYGREARYRAVVEQTDYVQSINDTGQQIYSASGSVIEPWYVEPGKWLRSTDFLLGRVPLDADVKDDPRFEFIEGATFTMPYGLTLRGGRVSRLDQKLARLGLGGI